MAASDGENRDAEQNRAEIIEQLERILRSREFQAPDRGRRFLRYVVEEAVDGRAERLTAYNIAQAVFGRGADFDAQSDPVVRIEAGRIRRALERYYLVCGSGDPVHITIPKGHYAPRFERRPVDQGAVNGPATGSGEASGSARPGRSGRKLGYRDLLVPVGVPAVFAALAMLALIRPLEEYLAPAPNRPPAARDQAGGARVIVEPLAVLGAPSGGAEIARGLNDQIISQLTKLDGVVVMTPASSSPADAVGNAVFALQGNVTFEDDALHVQLRLIRSADGRVIWAKRFDHDTTGQNVFDLQDAIGTRVVKDIAAISEIKDASQRR
jgi:TolB-like protein